MNTQERIRLRGLLRGCEKRLKQWVAELNENNRIRDAAQLNEYRGIIRKELGMDDD